MSVNSDNQLKFEEGISEPLTIMGADMEEFPFGSKFVVRIKTLITGHDHFMTSPGLEKKIKEGNVDIGDVITIEKVAKSEQYPYGYFSVSVVNKGKGPQIAKDRIEKSPVGAGFAQKDVKHEAEHKNDNMGLHELTLRVEKLEKIEETRSSESEKLPF